MTWEPVLQTLVGRELEAAELIRPSYSLRLQFAGEVVLWAFQKAARYLAPDYDGHIYPWFRYG